MKRKAGIFLLALFAAVAFAVCLPAPAYAGGGYVVEVGERVVLNASTRGNVRVTSGTWSCTGSWATIESKNGRSCTVRGISPSGDNWAYVSYSYTYYETVLGYTGSDVDQFKITVVAPDPKTVTLSPDNLNLEVGEGEQLTPTVTPSAAKTTYTYSSSDPNVADVSDTGYVTANGSGTARITVRTKNDKTADCLVTVTNPELLLSGTQPKDRAKEVSPAQKIVFEFNQKIEQGREFSSATLTDHTSGKPVEAEFRIEGKELFVLPKKLALGHSYTAHLPDGAVKRIGDTGSSKEASISFTVCAFDFSSDAIDGVNWALDRPIIIHCGDKAQKGARWEAISLVNQETGKTAPIRMELDGKTVTAHLLENLNYRTRYKLTVPAGAIKNSEDIALAEDWTVSFRTKPEKPEPVSFWPENGQTDIPVCDLGISMTFNVPVERGEEFYRISLCNVTSGQEVACQRELQDKDENRILRLRVPVEEMDYESDYQVTVPAGALKNEAGEPNERAYTLDFSTCSPEKDVIAAPVIKVTSRRMTLSAESGAQIWYTVDGSAPSSDGILYDGPVTLPDQKGVIRAAAVKNGRISVESRQEFESLFPYMSRKRTFGGNGNDRFWAVEATENGCVAVGSSAFESFGTGDWTDVEGHGRSDAVIVKFDAAGSVEWKRHFGGSGDDSYESVAVTDDGYVAVGKSYGESFGTGDWTDVEGRGAGDAVIVKYDWNGEVEWKRHFGGSSYDSYESVAVTDDGYVAAGKSYGESLGTGDWTDLMVSSTIGIRAIIVKYDREGNVEWKNQFLAQDAESTAQYHSVAAVEGGYVAGGYAELNDRRGRGICLVKYDTSGSKQWEKIFGGWWFDESYSENFDRCSMIEADEDGFVMVGQSSHGKFGRGDWSNVRAYGSLSGDGAVRTDAVIAKFDLDGTVRWKKNFGGEGNDFYNSVAVMEDGYLAAGHSRFESFGNGALSDVKGSGGIDAVLVKYDKSGNLQWKKTYGGSDDDSYYAVKGIDGACIVTGYSGSDAMLATYVFQDPDPAADIGAKPATVSVRVKDTLIKGEEFMADVYFQPTDNASSVNLELTYPSCLSYQGFASRYRSVYITEKQEGDKRRLKISCDFATDNPALQKDVPCLFLQLRFAVSENCNYGTYEIVPDLNRCFLMTETYRKLSFENMECGACSVVASDAKQMFIIGNQKISRPVHYRVLFYPKGVSDSTVKWSVSDPDIASVDEDGTLTPHKNGTVRLKAVHASAGIEAERDVTVSGMKTYLDGLSAEHGTFARSYEKTDLTRMLYVEEGAATVVLTPAFASGSLVSAEYGVWFNGDPMEIPVESLPKNVFVTKKEAGYDDTVYTIEIRKKSEQEETPDIRIDYAREALTGFVENAEYDINGETFVPNSKELALEEKQFGMTAVIVKKGVRGRTKDSEPLRLVIPARPKAPSGISSWYSEDQGGKITGVNWKMEYRKTGEAAWSACGGTEVANLEKGDYQVRLQASAVSFASMAAEIAVDGSGGKEPAKPDVEDGGGSQEKPDGEDGGGGQEKPDDGKNPPADSGESAGKQPSVFNKKKEQAVTAGDVTKTYGAKPFRLEVSVLGGAKLTYRSSNSAVADVDQHGTVTVRRCGVADITITAAETREYLGGQKTVRLTVKPKRVSIKSVKSPKRKTAKIKWKRAKEASGYFIQYAADKKFKKNKIQVKIGRNKTVSKTLKNLKRKKYYVRICAYAKTGGRKIQGAWSKVKIIKVKK